MVPKWVVVKRLGVLLGLFGLSIIWILLAVYGAIKFIERMGWL